MVKSTVRFPEGVVDEIEALVDEGPFESKSEFHRFATDYMLERVVDGYTPQTIDFAEIKADTLEDGEDDQDTPAELPFFESVVMVRQYALRDQISDAEDFIDHHYSPADRHALLLEEVLNAYRTERPDETPHSSKRLPEGRR